MRVATWDVGDLSYSNTDEPRTHVLVKQFTFLDLDIIALSATLSPSRDHAIEQMGGYTFFWNGKAGVRRHNVGFALKDVIASKIHENPIPISEDVLTLRLPLKKCGFAVFLSVHGPLPEDGDHANGEFYKILDKYLSAIPWRNHIFLMGNFNATVGKYNPQWEGVLGQYGHGIANSTGYSLLHMCARHNLVITNTLHDHAQYEDHHRVTWLHPRSMDWHMVDYLIVRQRHNFHVVNTKATSGLQFSTTGHKLVRSKIYLSLVTDIGNPPFIKSKCFNKPQPAPDSEKDLQAKNKKQENKQSEIPPDKQQEMPGMSKNKRRKLKQQQKKLQSLLSNPEKLQSLLSNPEASFSGENKEQQEMPRKSRNRRRKIKKKQKKMYYLLSNLQVSLLGDNKEQQEMELTKNCALQFTASDPLESVSQDQREQQETPDPPEILT